MSGSVLPIFCWLEIAALSFLLSSLLRYDVGCSLVEFRFLDGIFFLSSFSLDLFLYLLSSCVWVPFVPCL